MEHKMVILTQNGTPVARLTVIPPGAYPLAATFGHFRCHRGPQRHFTIAALSAAIADSWTGER
jgi:antitoxin (DNA-binding transcriptional repressor) of toxin-antitoxin stability system